MPSRLGLIFRGDRIIEELQRGVSILMSVDWMVNSLQDQSIALDDAT
jgi:hypothetical protein